MFTILTLARFFLSTVDLFTMPCSRGVRVMCQNGINVVVIIVVVGVIIIITYTASQKTGPY